MRNLLIVTSALWLSSGCAESVEDVVDVKDIYRNRYTVMQIIFAFFAIVFLVRLAYLQLIDKRYVMMARNNAIKEVEVYPTRGMVYDRNGELIIYNEAIYDIMLIPRMAKNVDSLKLFANCLISLKKITETSFIKKKNTLLTNLLFS